MTHPSPFPPCDLRSYRAQDRGGKPSPTRGGGKLEQVLLDLRTLRQWHARFGEGHALASCHLRQIRAGDGVLEQAVIVELGVEMQEPPAEPDGGAVHEYELARHPDRPLV